MLEAVVERVTRICPVRVISSEAAQLEGAQYVADRIPGLGPLAGIEAILTSDVAERYLIVACDQPLITEDVLKRLVNQRGAPIVVPRGIEGFLYPLPGVYDRSILENVSRRIEKRDLSLVRLLQDAGARTIYVSEKDEASLRSFNTPEELQQLFEIMKA
jgi:molybdopterin-guanine dinucleotide biosynthesis protein A